MRLFKRHTSLTAFLTVWLTVETAIGPALLWAQTDTLRPLNRQEDRSGLEELTRELAPDAVNPAAAGLEEAQPFPPVAFAPPGFEVNKTLAEILAELRADFKNHPTISPALDALERKRDEIPPEIKALVENWPTVVFVAEALHFIRHTSPENLPWKLQQLSGFFDEAARAVLAAPFIPETPIRVFWANPPVDHENDLAHLNLAARFLQEIDPSGSYALFINHTSAIYLGPIQDATGQARYIGYTGLQWPYRPGWSTDGFRFADLVATLVQEADHHRFRTIHKKSDLIANYEFEFSHKQKTPLTESTEPLPYLREIDGHQAEHRYWLQLARTLDEKSRRNLIVWIGKRLLEVSQAIGYLENTSQWGQILTRKGEELVRQQRLQQTELERAAAEILSSTAGLEEGQGRVDRFVQGLAAEAPQGLTPMIIGAGLEEQHPELRALGKVRGLPVLFAGRMTPQEVAVELISRWDAREAVFAGLEEEVGRYKPLIEEAGISVRPVTPKTAGQILLAILAQAAGMEERELAGRAGQFLDDVAAFAGQV